jgi:hypothetical protein
VNNLLPCPFCGGTELSLHRASFYACLKCGAFGPDRGKGAWNRRYTPSPSNTQQAAAAVLAAQEAKGLAKYGTTLDTAGLSLLEIATHYQQEAADALMYATAMVELMKKEAKP